MIVSQARTMLAMEVALSSVNEFLSTPIWFQNEVWMLKV